MHLALYQPDLPPNVGTLIRLGACMGVPVHIIEPCGFPFSLRAVRRSTLDYADRAELVAHRSWDAFQARRPAGRLVLLSTKARLAYTQFDFAADDTLMVGRETVGVPDEVAASADARVLIPMQPGLRSINVAVAAGMVLGEALRQTGGFAAPIYKE
jgi:tRNA (cytidine/uridine-2'-O-)-methyltransferase